MPDVTLSTALKQIQPLPDSLENDHISHVVGNKNDTSGSGSIVGLIKAADAKALAAVLATQAAEAAAVLARSILEQQFHAACKVYPTLANGITIQAGAGLWAEGLEVDIIPAGQITHPFTLTYLNIEAVSANDVYEVSIYNSAELARQRVSKISNQSGVPSVPISSVLQPAGTKISAKVAAKSGGSPTVTISLSYRE
jgi:hypothetical protein